MAAENTQPVNRIERIIAYMVVGVILLSIVSFAAVIIGTATGMEREDFAAGIWPTVGSIPLFGLPAAMLLIIGLTIAVAVRRSRENKRGAE